MLSKEVKKMAKNEKNKSFSGSNIAKERKILYRFISEYELSLAVNGNEPLKVTADFFQDLYTLSRNC